VLTIEAEDSLGNTVSGKEMGRIEVESKGSVVSGEDRTAVENVRMSILVINEEDQSLVRWQAEPYGFINPITTGRGGIYELMLPGGTYQILMQKQGFQRLRTSSFSLLNPRFITVDFELEERRGIRGLFEDFVEYLTL